jgi:hypothetical protein
VGAENDLGTSGPEVLDGGESGTDAGVISDFEGVVFWDVKVDSDEDFFSGNIEITDSEFIHHRRAVECLMKLRVSRMEETTKRNERDDPWLLTWEKGVGASCPLLD